MIEIVKEGTKKQCTCNNCGTEFSYEDEDIMVYFTKSFWNVLTQTYKNDSKRYVSCPECKSQIEVE